MFSKDLIKDLPVTGTGEYLFQVRHYPSKAKHIPLTHILNSSFS